MSGADRVLSVPEFPRYAMGLLHTSQAFGKDTMVLGTFLYSFTCSFLLWVNISYKKPTKNKDF